MNFSDSDLKQMHRLLATARQAIDDAAHLAGSYDVFDKGYDTLLDARAAINSAIHSLEPPKIVASTN